MLSNLCKVIKHALFESARLSECTTDAFLKYLAWCWIPHIEILWLLQVLTALIGSCMSESLIGCLEGCTILLVSVICDR